MTTILVIIHVIVSLFLIVIVLLQQGKGADMGATFGGSSNTVFGTEGPLPLLNKVTTLAAITFMVTSISLAYLSAHKSTSSVMQKVDVAKPQEKAIERAPEPLTTEPGPDLPLQPAEPAVQQQAPAVTGEAVTEAAQTAVAEEMEKAQEEAPAPVVEEQGAASKE